MIAIAMKETMQRAIARTERRITTLGITRLDPHPFASVNDAIAVEERILQRLKEMHAAA